MTTTDALSGPLSPPVDVDELRRRCYALGGAYVVVGGLAAVAALVGRWDLVPPLFGSAVLLLIAATFAADRACTAARQEVG